MTISLIMVSVIILACVLLNKISSKLGFPVLLAFIILGMLFGSDGIMKIPFDDYDFSEKICSFALIFIMFYGGFGTNWKEAKPIATKAILLSSFGVFLTALFTGFFCHYIFNFDWIESFLISSVISSTDAASVFSILRSKRLNLKYNTASLLEVESGSNDPFAYMLTILVLSLKDGTANFMSITYMLFAQIVYGIVAGIIIAYLSAFILRKFNFNTAGFDTIFVVAIAIFSYALPTAIGGNGYLSTYIVGIILGNIKIKNKKTFVPFFDGITGLMQMLIFFLLGLLSFPSKLPNIILPALLIALFITFIARPLTVFTILTPFRCTLSQKLVVSWAGLRGASSIVFAVIAMISTKASTDIFHITFFIVLFSILLQGSLLPLLSKKLKMIDNTNINVMKTFTDYSDEVPIQFIKFSIPNGHPWNNMLIKDVLLPPETILVLLIRKNKQIVPNGKTKIVHNDILILCAKSSDNIKGVQLIEKHISKGDNYIGSQISDIQNDSNNLIIMIKRNDRVVIPKGKTILREGDTLVINQQN